MPWSGCIGLGHLCMLWRNGNGRNAGGINNGRDHPSHNNGYDLIDEFENVY